jgi:hypothetical protein
VDWIHLAQDRIQWWSVVNTVNEHSGTINGWEFVNQMCNYQILMKGCAS